MLRPVIMIGCGGSGINTIRIARNEILRLLKRQRLGNQLPHAWQFIGIDCHSNQESLSVPKLPSTDHIDLSKGYSTLQQVAHTLDKRYGLTANPRSFAELIGWRPNTAQLAPLAPFEMDSLISRAAGRALGLLHLGDSVAERLSVAFARCRAGGPELVEVSKKLGLNVPPGQPVPMPMTIIVGSMTGNTGSAILLDVIDLIRSTDSAGAFPTLVAYTPDLFKWVSQESSAANAAAFTAELLSAYWDDNPPSSPLIPAQIVPDTRGPHSVYLIGRRNLDGLEMASANDVYQAVGKTLCSFVTSALLQDLVYNFIQVDWYPRSHANAGGYGFAPSRLNGVASSFGSATVSVGREHFREYLTMLLHRSIVEHLLEGFHGVANSELGDAAKSMTSSTKMEVLASRNVQNFLTECGLDEQSTVLNRIFSELLSTEVISARARELSEKLVTTLKSSVVQSAHNTVGTLISEAESIKAAEFEAWNLQFDGRMRAWRSETYRRILTTITDFSALVSLPVVRLLITATRSEVLRRSELFSERGRNSSDRASNLVRHLQTNLNLNSGSPLALSMESIPEIVDQLSNAAVMEWSGQTWQRLATTLEAISTTLFVGVEVSLDQSLADLELANGYRDGNPPVIKGWPRNDGVVPASFMPSTTEFLLEEPAKWPEMSWNLLAKSLSTSMGRRSDVLAAARLEILRGGFSRNSTQGAPIGPLIWTQDDSLEPVWEEGQRLSLKQYDMDSMTNRIDNWLMRSNSATLEYLSEDLEAFLLPTHRRTGMPIAEHKERLTRFAQCLHLALTQSQPMIEIDRKTNSEVHPDPVTTVPMVSGIPFGADHPARELTTQILQGHFRSSESFDWVFSAGECESVSFTNFIARPLNPSVIRSFTDPLGAAVAKHSDLTLRTSFWRWRRSRNLKQSIPLPEDLLLAAIRGFSVARILGLATANSEGDNQVSTTAGVFSFPRLLLTKSDRDDLLPRLLEAMILAFADVPLRGSAAFAAYGALVDYGTGGGLIQGFEVDNIFADVLRTGEYSGLTILDHAQAERLSGATLERIETALRYTQVSLARLDRLASQPLDSRSWRNSDGSLEPAETMTRELEYELIRGLTEVQEALERFRVMELNGPEVF